MLTLVVFSMKFSMKLKTKFGLWMKVGHSAATLTSRAAVGPEGARSARHGTCRHCPTPNPSPAHERGKELRALRYATVRNPRVAQSPGRPRGRNAFITPHRTTLCLPPQRGPRCSCSARTRPLLRPHAATAACTKLAPKANLADPSRAQSDSSRQRSYG